MSRARYRIGTRGSKLALAQTQQVIDLLHSFAPEAEFQIEIITTSGERDSRPLTEIGGKGIFTAELEQALLDGWIDIAVHSAKDLPTEISSELAIAAYMPRIDPRETLISHNGERLLDLPRGAVVGTSSPRRRYQLLRFRPDLNFADIRGNLDTRIRKVHSGEYNAIVAARAGLIRLGLTSEVSEIFPLDLILPPAGQGAIALQCRHDDIRVFKLLEMINYQPTALAVMAERAVLKSLDVGCNDPVGVFASLSVSGQTARSGEKLYLRAVLFDIESHEAHHAEIWGNPKRWRTLAEKISKQLRKSQKKAEQN